MFQIKFTNEELNAVVGALANLPYGQVFQLIGSIQTQVDEQVKIVKASVDDIPDNE